MCDATNRDLEYMQLALREARNSAERGEVPVGAVLVIDDEVVAAAGNRTIGDIDPTAHAEILALRAAAKSIGNHRILRSTLYVTIEPCAMCAGALVQARVTRLVYGADDLKGGAVRSCFTMLSDPRLNHQVEIVSGVKADESVHLLQDFFAQRR